MAVPPDERAPLEVIEPQLVFQFFVWLLDRPALMRETHERPQRRGRGQRHQIRRDPRRGAEIALEEQPDLGGETSRAPVVRGCDAQRDTVGRPGPIRAVAPADTAPGARPDR